MKSFMPCYRFVGINPGQQGAVAIIDGNSRVLSKKLMPLESNRKDVDIRRLRLILTDLVTESQEHLYLCIEKDTATAEQGNHSTAYKMGFNNAIPIVAASVLGLRHIVKPPIVWQKPFHAGKGERCGSPSDGKKELARIKSEKAARGLWPHDSLTSDNSRGQTPNHRVVDALLLAEFCRRHFLNLENGGGK